MAPTPALHRLATEQISADTTELDRWSPLEIVTRMNAGNAAAVAAVQTCLPQVASAVDLCVARLARGGRLIYIGAGSSGRLAGSC